MVFFKGSRYEHVDAATRTDARDRVYRYKRIRYIAETRPQYGYSVRSGDRLDVISFEVFHDVERFWRICDSNLTMWPEQLTQTPARVIGIPGSRG